MIAEVLKSVFLIKLHYLVVRDLLLSALISSSLLSVGGLLFACNMYVVFIDLAIGVWYLKSSLTATVFSTKCDPNRMVIKYLGVVLTER